MARIGKISIVDTIISETTGQGAILCHARVLRTHADSPTSPAPKQDDFWYEVPISDGWGMAGLDADMLLGALVQASETGLQASEVISMNRVRDPFVEMQAGLLCIPWHADATLGMTFSASPLNERIALNQPPRNVKGPLPLGNFTQVRMIGILATPVVLATSPRCRLMYKTGAHSTLLADYASIGQSEVSIPFTAAGGNAKDSGWIDMAIPARADSYVALTELGGNGSLSPVLGNLTIFFRKP